MSALKLFCQTFQEAAAARSSSTPLLFIHGLFGNSNNFRGVAKAISSQCEADAMGVDLRNHGRSPHSNVMDHSAMAADIVQTMDEQKIDSFVPIGHSMGGKVAMHTALTNPERVSSLVVVDVAPESSPSTTGELLGYATLMHNLDISGAKKLAEVDEMLKDGDPNASIRQFLLTNLERGSDGFLQWRINTGAIVDNFQQILGWDPLNDGRVYEGPTLFLAGSRSSYVQDKHFGRISSMFPNSRVEYLDTGHWVHAENPKEFVASVSGFLQGDR